MSNRILLTTTQEELKERLRDEIMLNRELLYTKDKENLYIKYQNELVPIGGKLKQNYLIPGDNIEIIRSDFEGNAISPEEIRLMDDIDVNTVTLSPDGENTLNWKGTVKLGELHDSNKLFVLTKESEVNVPLKTLIGGELLIKYFTNLDENPHYGHYALTCSSTGSWSLKGATQEVLDVRMCKMKKLDDGEYFYGLKLPAGQFKDTRIEEHRNYSTVNLTGKVNFRLGANAEDLYIYSGNNSLKLTKDEHMATDSPGYSRDLWTVAWEDLAELLGWTDPRIFSKDSDAPIAEILKPGVKACFTLDTREASTDSWRIHSTSNIVRLRKTGLSNNSASSNQATATYTLFRTTNNWGGNESYQLVDRGNETTMYGSGASNYNHWYTMPMTDFFRVTGINPQGEWRQWNNNRYEFGLRIYTKGLGTRITVVAILDTYNNRNQVKAISAVDMDVEFNWESGLINLKDGSDPEAYPAMYNNNEVDLFRFIDRTATPQRQGLQIKLVRFFAADAEGLVTVGNTLGELDFLNCVKFDQTYLTNHYNEVSGFVNNRIPIWTADGNSAPILLYSGQTTNDNERTSWLFDIDTSFRALVSVNYETIEFMNEIIIDSAEFWFNGWKDIPEALQLENYKDSDFDYVVLADKSNDNDSFAETFYMASSGVSAKISALQETGEDNAPYKFVITGTISMNDLRNIASVCRNPNRQIYLDMSGATVATDARVWSDQLFASCVSLRGLKLPQGVTSIADTCFIWCTYMRELDFIPSASTLNTIGAANSWSPSVGLLTSTRVRSLIVPASVRTITKYFVGSSCNVKNLIFLHQNNDSISVDQWSFLVTKYGSNNVQSTDRSLPENFHCFMANSWRNGYIRNFYTNNAGNTYMWGGTDGWWTREMVNSIVTFDPYASQETWQDFADRYKWDEELVNLVRACFGQDNPIEIKSSTVY